MTVAIVTGASRGIGRAIALQLADDGMDIAVNDIEEQLPQLESLKSEIEQKGRRSMCVVADVSNEDHVQSMVKKTVEALGELNVMIANAGIIVPKRLLELSLHEWEKVQSVNATGAFLCYREAGRQMIAQGKGGKIIGACSIAGYRPSGNALAYSVSKWTIRGLTQAVALDLAEHNINVKTKMLMVQRYPFECIFNRKLTKYKTTQHIVQAQWPQICGKRLTPVSRSGVA
ncbi:SDR family NAD(P)-dependent oxidoreductase [Aspergillus puulaauensis]|uniref:Putative secondary metabolism biosynthetic enzyme n=1 Tax=Aspergillus puulaauensis TaxID=1220207 RepID=A0A7R8AKN7_9EURO|nr:putative secondary metabolism biosynthetic enzyme [Aspergillus puulaauensis]BCS21822.1 putative secondary metabolism biosynthetic enzyme [Aspergillus puulaauensis]